MSHRIETTLTCSYCNHQFNYKLFRSIWGGEPGNLELVMSDKINFVSCPICKSSSKLNFPFLYTNSEKNFAVWWEPYYDPQIDEEVAVFKKLGRGINFYSEAPRIKDWQEFKNIIIKYEVGELKGIPFTFPNSPKSSNLFKRIIKKLKTSARTKM